MKVSGKVYRITAPGYWYVGSTRRSMSLRFAEHMTGQSGATRLTDMVRQLGREAFEYEVIEADVEKIKMAEQRWIDWHRANWYGESLNSIRATRRAV